MYFFKIETHAYLFPNIGSYSHSNIPLMSASFAGTEEVKTQSFLVRVKVHKTQEGKECRNGTEPVVVKEVLVEVPVDVTSADLEAVIAEALQGVLEFLKEPFEDPSEAGSDGSDEEEDSLDVSEM